MICLFWVELSCLHCRSKGLLDGGGIAVSRHILSINRVSQILRTFISLTTRWLVETSIRPGQSSWSNIQYSF
jgi:hypothetical protein